MALPIQPAAGSSSRMQSAPINIEYRNQDDLQFYREQHYRWNHHFQNHFDDDEDESEQPQNHHSDEDEDQMMMLQSGFSGGTIEPPEEVEHTIKSGIIADGSGVVEQQLERNDDTITRQKISEMNIDLFEQLLAENERKLRQLISYVENVHLVLK